MKIKSRFIIVFTLYIIILSSDCMYFSQGFPTPPNADLNICNHWNEGRYFLGQGERGELHARNLSYSNYRKRIFNVHHVGDFNETLESESWYQCNIELVTCSECVIKITFTYSNFSKTCGNSIKTAKTKIIRKCFCEHIIFSEPPYDIPISGQIFCGDTKFYRSKTRTVQLTFYFRITISHIFSIQFLSERNVDVVSGSPLSIDLNSQIISTPFFPIPYPRDFAVEHLLTCDSDNCHVMLEFTDFQLGLVSMMRIYDSGGNLIDSYNGDIFRPPIIMSTGRTLLIQFRGNGVTSIGYKADVKFLSNKNHHEKFILPNTVCGGLVEGSGGAITMMNMIENHTETVTYDCIWIIKPANNFMTMKTHILLRIDSFIGMEPYSAIKIHQGTVSTAMLVEITDGSFRLENKNTHITQILAGFYIHLKGKFGKNSRLAIVYSIFNYLNCYVGSEFLCRNNHCLSTRLYCDGFDQCGDNSDEPDSCKQQRLGTDSKHRHWYTNKPNYFFPKLEQYPDLKTATGIFVMSTVGILFVLSGWMIVLYRMGIRARNQRELQNQLQTISELLDNRDRHDEQNDNPPAYEAPPDYEEVVKIDIGHEGISKKLSLQKIKRIKEFNKDEKTQGATSNIENRNMLTASKLSNTANEYVGTEPFQSVADEIIKKGATCETSSSNSTPEKVSNKNFAQPKHLCNTFDSTSNITHSAEISHRLKSLSFDMACHAALRESLKSKKASKRNNNLRKKENFGKVTRYVHMKSINLTILALQLNRAHNKNKCSKELKIYEIEKSNYNYIYRNEIKRLSACSSNINFGKQITQKDNVKLKRCSSNESFLQQPSPFCTNNSDLNLHSI